MTYWTHLALPAFLIVLGWIGAVFGSALAVAERFFALLLLLLPGGIVVICDGGTLLEIVILSPLAVLSRAPSAEAV